MLATIVTSNLGTAQVLALIAAILFALSAVAQKKDASFYPFLVSAGLTLVAVALLFAW